MRLATCFAYLLLTLAPAQADNELNVCTRDLVDSFIVPESYLAPAHQLLPKTLYNHLVVWDTKRQVYVPDLAERWTVNDDGTVYRFKLKENIHFHQRPWFEPSRPLNAEDIVFTFTELMRNPALVQYWTFFANTVASITGDGHWVKFTLKRPSLDFISQLSGSFAVIRSAEYAQKPMRQNGLQLPVGTGPFMLQAFDDQETHFVQHPRYPANIDLQSLVLKKAPTEQGRYTKLRTGSCEFNTEISGPLISAAESLPSVLIARTTRPVLFYLGLDIRTPLLQDLTMRQAIAASIDKQRVARLVYQREDYAAHEIEQGKHRVGAKHQDVYDPDLARQLLGDLNVAQPTLIEFITESRQSYGLYKQTSKVLAEFFAAVGIRYKERVVTKEQWVRSHNLVTTIEPPELNQNEGGVYLNLEGTSLPTSSLSKNIFDTNMYAQKQNASCCKSVDSLIKDFESASNPSARTEALHRLANEANRTKFIIPLAHIGEFVHAWRDTVSGIVRGPMGLWDFSGVTVH